MKNLLNIGKEVFQLEGEALNRTAGQLGEPFLKAVHILDKCQGKVIITGLGKSGIAGKKISATLSSTGVPALFLHAGEAGHGDLGVVSQGDVVLALSYSGETQELNDLIPRFKLLDVPVLALTGSPKSTLAEISDVLLDVSVPSYPWPYGLLPTASNAVTVAMGDALAVTLLMSRGFKESDFGALHPGGLLGRKLLVKVGNLMHRGEELPIVTANTPMREVLIEMTVKKLGVACVVDDTGCLIGIITDGDLRRLFESESDPLNCSASEAMIDNPKSTSKDLISAQVLNEMEKHSITALPVVEEDNKLIGIIHIHDLIKMETNR